MWFGVGSKHYAFVIIVDGFEVDKHPDKTFIGKVERGFDFLGCFLEPEIVKVSISILNNLLSVLLSFTSKVRIMFALERNT